MDGLVRSVSTANPMCVHPYSTLSLHVRHAWLDAPFSWVASYPCIHIVHSLVVSSVVPLSTSVKISKFLSKVTSVGSCGCHVSIRSIVPIEKQTLVTGSNSTSDR